MHPLTYLHLQMQLEGIGLIGDRLVRELDVVPDGDLPLLLIARLSTREVATYFNESLPTDLQRLLGECIHNAKFPRFEPVVAELGSHNLQVKTGYSVTYIFPAHAADSIDRDITRLAGPDPRIQRFGFNGLADHIFAIEREGRVVSACVSARENEHCGEAWAYTDPKYRKQGLDAKVVHAWANSLTRVGKIPFYSHEMGNTASAGLAKRLSLQLVYEEIDLSPVLK